MRQLTRAQTIEELRERLRQLQQAHRPARATASLTGTGLDRLLPPGGLPGGTLVEWLSDGEGTGAVSLALALTAQLLQSGGALVLFDGSREFYPPAAAAAGIPLERTVVVRPASVTDGLWALEQALRCRAVAVALGWIEKLNDRVGRRLQLAAEAGGGVGMLVRPAVCRAEPSWAEVRLLVRPTPTPESSPGRRIQVEVLQCRGGAGGEAVELELSDEACAVRVVPPLADPAPVPRAARA